MLAPAVARPCAFAPLPFLLLRLCLVAFRVGAPLPPDMWNQITQPSGDEEEEEEEEEEEAAEPPLRRHSVLWNWTRACHGGISSSGATSSTWSARQRQSRDEARVESNGQSKSQGKALSSSLSLELYCSDGPLALLSYRKGLKRARKG